MAVKEKERMKRQELLRELRNGMPRRLYVLFGEEQFLLQKDLQTLRGKTVDPLSEAFNYHRFNSENFDVRDFSDAVENLPMMAERTMVQVDDIDFFKLPESEREHVIAVLSDIPDYCTVVLAYLTTTYNPDKRLKKLYDAIENNADVILYERQGQRELTTWIMQHFAAQNKKISPELCAYLIELTGGMMKTMEGEIEKIAAYSGADSIVKQDIDAVTEPVLDAAVFQMTDDLGQGQYGAALRRLHQLLQMQQEPLSILGAVGGHIRRLGAARTLLDHGRGAGDLAKLCGIRDYPARKTMEMARRFSAAFCARAASLVVETDMKMKTSFDDNQRLLEMLILQLAQEACCG